MACRVYIDVANNKGLKNLVDFCGTNCTLLYSYITTVIDDINAKGSLKFTDDFKQYLAENNIKASKDANSSNSRQLKDAIMDYCAKVHPSYEFGIRDNKVYDKIIIFGYNNISAREYAKRVFANSILMIRMSDVLNNQKISGSLQKYYLDAGRKVITVKLAKDVAAYLGKPNEARQIFAKITRTKDNDINPAAAIDEIIGDYSNVPVTLQNLIALFKEVSCIDENGEETSADAFYKEVLRDSRLGEIRKAKEFTQDEQADSAAELEENVSEEDDDVEFAESSFDTMITMLNNKLGVSGTYLTNLGLPIRALLGSLKKLKRPGNIDATPTEDLDNPLGIADVLDVNQCATVLYHYGNFENPERMLKSIKNISQQLEGFEAFDTLYETLSSNENLKIMFFRTFSKVVIGKLETVVRNGRSFNVISNNTDKTTILLTRFMNNLKTSSITEDVNYSKSDYSLLELLVSSYSPNIIGGDIATFEKICEDIANLLSRYYGKISNIVIRNFIKTYKEGNNDVNELDNVNKLLSCIKFTIEEADNTKDEYKSRESRLALIRQNNRKFRDAGELDKIVDTNPIYAESYLANNAIGQAVRLAKLLSNYVLVSTPLNSRTIDNNQSSDVINKSMLTDIRDMLQSRLNDPSVTMVNGKPQLTYDENSPIMQFAKQRQQSRQYDFSSILVEQRDEKGNIESYGLFRRDIDGSFVPTDYCLDLLQINLFNGANNIDGGSASDYRKMTKGDYIGTAWRNFFDQERNKPIKRNENSPIHDFAHYFMRIPSDAPNNFTVRAPKYNIAGLLHLTNEKDIKDGITDILKAADQVENSINPSNIILFKNPITVRKYSKTLGIKQLAEHILSVENNLGYDATCNIVIPMNLRRSLNSFEGKEVVVAFKYSPTGTYKGEENRYFMKGVYKKGVLTSAVFAGFDKNTLVMDTEDNIYSTVRKYLFDNAEHYGIATRQYDIDTNHKLFKQLRNLFKQELLDMVTAINVIFETTRTESGDYIIAMQKNGKPKLKKSKVLKDNNNHNGLHPIYHFDPKKKSIYTVDSNGVCHATGRVFTSDRFMFYAPVEDGNGNIIDDSRNFGNELLEECFKLFETYDTSMDELLHFDAEGNVVLTPYQESKIDEKIGEFIKEYLEFGKRKFDSFKEFIDNEELSSKGLTSINDSNILEFLLNYHIMYAGFNDLFEGDSKFYKDAQTFLKRAKEAQGSGVPYGLNDLTKPIEASYTVISSPLDSATFTFKRYRRNAKTGEVSLAEGTKRIVMRDGFKAITIENTTKTDTAMLEALVSYLTNPTHMGSHVMTEDKARTLLYGKLQETKNGAERIGGYQDTKINDAQSYITFDEWVRRITLRGDLPKYKPLIDKILDYTRELTVEDITEFIQVQKNFYYDQHYDPDTNTISPRQIKNAEFVLVPRLVQGTELEVVLRAMTLLGVDQLNTVETSKASNAEIFTIWDNEGHMDENFINDVMNNPRTFKSEIMKNGKYAADRNVYSYRYLYTQLETPQHVNDKNKAGIQFVKKILDNITENSAKELQDAKNDFLNLYSANIKSSFLKVAKRFNFPLDSDGNLLLDDNGELITKQVDAEGNVTQEGINYEEFFKALEEELSRLGLDGNLLDYCTLDPNGVIPSSTIMPNYFSLVSTKLENLVNSIFNNNITRQTLPGFHAAQITGMGFRSLAEKVLKDKSSNPLQYHPQLWEKIGKEDIKITDREYQLLSEEEQKEYKKGGVANYIEIKLPAKNFGFDRSKYSHLTKEEQDREFLRQLRAIGADEIVGYRIPTEGKQSMAIMKVVGFTDDALGSTIIVPDAWVSQTGSDFDIDTVYGIQYSTYIDSNNIIRKVNYITDYKELYKNYILSSLTKEERNELFDNINLPEQRIQELKDSITEEDKANGVTLTDKIRAEKQIYLEADLEDIAETKGLQSFVEFTEGRIEDLNTTEARNNKILDCFKTILGHPESYEENLSRSNFDDIIDALNKYLAGSSRKQRAARTPYNFLDQADYQEDAMGGATLKGISVIRDTLCSVCNLVKPILYNNSAITVWYDAKHSKEELIKSFGAENVRDAEQGGYNVTHTTFGWSRNNYNSEGKLITAYSSQTTSHILDAIKSGAIPNINTLTFKVFKTFVDVGSDYDTAVAFITQPAVKRIVDAYEATNSIYSAQRGQDFILKAVRSILDELNIEYSYTDSLEKCIRLVNNVYGDIKELSIDDKNLKNVAINVETLDRRNNNLDEFSEPYDALGNLKPHVLLHDLEVILQYNKIDKLSRDAEEAARVLNPDKFGAKQTIYETRQVFKDIVNSIQKHKNEELGTTFRLALPGGQHLVSAIYPELEDIDNSNDAIDTILRSKTFVENSKYKTLAAFLKYSSAVSIKIAKTLFVTQSDEFVSLLEDPINGLASVLNADRRISPKIAKEFQNYVVSYIVNQSAFLQAPLRYNITGRNPGFLYEGRGPRQRNEEEVNRVFGFGRTPKITIKKPIRYQPIAYSGVISPTEENTYLVFDTDVEGTHEVGEGRTAVEFFGAEPGRNEGVFNNSKGNNGSFAIPLHSDSPVEESVVRGAIHRLYNVARTRPTKTFKVPFRAISEEIANGYTGERLLKLFAELGPIPRNIQFSEEWVASGLLEQESVVEIPFSVADISKPTQEELDTFCALSPAQKVKWIKDNFDNAGIFEYIEPQLVNEETARSNVAGSQTLRFSEDRIDLETIRIMFSQCYSNSNPLIACATADVVKYAFLVEGYRMGIGNVSKMINNDVLLLGGPIDGTNIVHNSNEVIRNLSELIVEHGEELIENFVRSNSEVLAINKAVLQKLPKGGYELDLIGSTKLIHISDNTEENKQLLEKYHIAYFDKNGVPVANKYVKLRINGDYVLYKIYPRRVDSKNVQYFLIPLNQLQKTENARWSVNGNNNKYYDVEYYKAIADDYIGQCIEQENRDSFYAEYFNKAVQAIKPYANEHAAPNYRVDRSKHTLPILNDNPSFSRLIDSISDWYSNRDGNPLFIWYGPLSQYMTLFGDENAIHQTITLNDGRTRVLKFSKVSYYNLIKKYTNTDNTTSTNNLLKPIDTVDAWAVKYIDLIREVASYNREGVVPKFYGDIYKITDTNLESEDDLEGILNFSTATDVAVESVKVARIRARQGDENAYKLDQRYRDEGIIANKEEIEPKVAEVLVSTANYVEELASKIKSKLENYMPNPDGDGYLGVDDVRVINHIKKDRHARMDYIKTLLEANRLVEEFDIIKEVNIESEDISTQNALNKIQKAISQLRDMPITAKAKELWVKEVLDKETDNPLIKNKFMSVIDGFYRTNWFNATFNDIQETSNPLIQLTMKNFQTDLAAKEWQSRRQAEAFVKHINELKKKASREGKRFDINKIIDEYGRFRQNHNDQFIKDRNALQKKVAEAKKRGVNSVEHLKAILEYNEWKAKHLEQEAVQEYYDERNRLLREALYGKDVYDEDLDETYHVRGFAEYLSKYQQLVSERTRLRKLLMPDTTDPELEEELDRLNYEIGSMLRIDPEDLEDDIESEETVNKKLLSEYVNNVKGVENKYYKYDKHPGFDEEVEYYTNIIKSFELSDKLPSEYANNEAYVKAKLWLFKNVDEIPIWGENGWEITQELKQAYDILRGIHKRDFEGKRVRSTYKTKYGTLDYFAIPEEDIAKVKEEQQNAFRISGEPGYSDRILISNAPRDEETVVYKAEWYRRLTGSETRASKEWQKTVRKINEILEKYYDNKTSSVDLRLIPNTEEGLNDINTLCELYDQLKDIRRSERTPAQRNWIKKHVAFKVNEDKLAKDELYVNDVVGAGALKRALKNLIYDIDSDGNVIPRNFLYGYIEPKEEFKEEFIDKDKTNAFKVIKERTTRRVGATYSAVLLEKEKTLSAEEFKDWFYKNHVYNPYTHSYEPLSIFWEYGYNADRIEKVPTFFSSSRKIRDGYLDEKQIQEVLEEEEGSTYEEVKGRYISSEDFRNPNYKQGLGHESNYKYGSNPEYDVALDLSDVEQEAAYYIKNILLSLANTQDAKRYLERGWLPARASNKLTSTKAYAKEILKIFGYVNEPYDPNDWNDTVSYSRDTPKTMPMLEKIKGKYGDIQTKDLKRVRAQEEGETDEHYAAEIEKINKENEQIERDNLLVHKALLDNDWISVIEDFIIKAGTYNAVQDNKYELFFAKELLAKYGTYVESYDKYGNHRFKKDFGSSTDEEAEYQREPDRQLIAQFDNQLRRILYNQFKDKNSPKLMKWMSVLQSFTSAQFMMLNVKGGIANVTLGNSQIRGEAFAREFFGLKHYGRAKLFYATHILDYISNSGSEKASSLAGAIIKFFDIVDYDEHTGVSRLTKDAKEIFRRIRDFGYTPQTAGEHGMQNTALFAMLMSHRLFVNPRHEEFNQPKYVIKNYNEYIQDVRESVLKSILSEAAIEQYERFKKKLSKNANDFKDFAWYRKDVVSEWLAVRCTREQQRKFVELEKERKRKAQKEFEDDTEHPTLLSQLELGKDGKLAIKHTTGPNGMLGSIDINKENGEPSDALYLLANFKRRAISVNKYIHGVYDKSGRAQFEKTFIGSLFMQYHKHLPLGIMKRYRIRGMYSEERGAVAKGMYTSLIDFLSIPFRKHKEILNLTKDEVDAGEGLQNIVKSILDFATHYKLFYDMMPEYDRANIRRMLGDISGILAALFIVVATRMLADDDDEEGLLYNLCMYEGDRLATEAGTYLPFVAITESKKLLQSPIAAGSAITDLISSVSLLLQLIMQGDEFDGTYKSGKFAGESKFRVYIERRIPIWRGIKTSFIDIKDNNHYYKVGKNVLGFLDVNKTIDKWKYGE